MKKTVVFCLCIIFTLISASVCLAQDWGGTGFSDYNNFGGADSYLDPTDYPEDDIDDGFTAGPSPVSAPAPTATSAPVSGDSAAKAAESAAAAANSAESAAAAAAAAAEAAESAAAAAESVSANAPQSSSPAPQQPPVRIVIPMMTVPAYPPAPAYPAVPPVQPAPPPPVYYPAPAYPVVPPVQPALPPAPVYPVAPPVQPAPPAYRPPITVIPAMPSPYSNCLYRVQIGAFSSAGLAQQCFSRLLSAGFTPSYEPYGNVTRIVLSGIRAAEMPLIVQRLAAAGFSEVWIREEK